MAKKTTQPEPRIVDHEVRVKYTPTEALELTDEAKQLEERIAQLEEDLDAEIKERKKRLEAMRREVERMRDSAAKRGGMRTFKCRLEIKNGQAFYYDAETDELRDQRAALPEELQDAFGFDDSKDDDLPLEPDYTPSPDSPQGEFEKPRKKKGKRGK